MRASPSRPFAGPFLKWAGGKSQLLPEIRQQMPATLAGRGYVEPFVGSGAVFFEVQRELRPARSTLLDANPELVNLWVQIRDDVDALIPLLRDLDAQHNAPGVTEAARETLYYGVRDHVPPAGTAEAAARFLYLNRTCFNGLHRLNSKGRFNVPIGRYTRPVILDEKNLRAVAAVLDGVTIEVADFRHCDRFIRDGDFVYLDPPYEPVSTTSSFTRYARDAFTPDHQRALRDLLAELGQRADWLLSNSAAPLIDALYTGRGWAVHTVMASRRINSKAENRGDVEERLVTSWGAGSPPARRAAA